MAEKELQSIPSDLLEAKKLKKRYEDAVKPKDKKVQKKKK